MSEFKIHHIDYATLMSISKNKGCLSYEGIDSQYIAESIAMFTLLTDKNKLRQTDIKVAIWARIGEAASWLLRHNWYSLVATVECNSALLAIKSTTNIDSYWFMNSNLEIHKVTARNTSVLDIVEADNNHYLITTGGFYDLDSSSFISKYGLQN